MAETQRKVQFSAIPLRALGDGRLTDRDYRILGVVAAHDRMSSVSGIGQGAWASHRTMAAEVGGAGADYARFSVSINKLVDLGYLESGHLEIDGRKRRYRILYTDEDRLPERKLSAGDEVCSSANQPADDSLPRGGDLCELVCRRGALSDGKDSETEPQYISLSEETDSAEAGEINSPEGARLAARDVVRLDMGLSDEANLARLDRAISQGRKVRESEWTTFLASLDPVDGRAAARISRLIERMWIAAMDEDLNEAAGTSEPTANVSNA